MPHYSTLWCRATGLDIPVPARRSGPVHLVVDSTGLKVCGEGEWKVRQHGFSKRRLWRKLHLGVDQATGMILSHKAVLGKGARPVIPPRPRYSAPQGGRNHATARGQGPAANPWHHRQTCHGDWLEGMEGRGQLPPTKPCRDRNVSR